MFEPIRSRNFDPNPSSLLVRSCHLSQTIQQSTVRPDPKFLEPSSLFVFIMLTAASSLSRSFTTSQVGRRAMSTKVAVLGAGGGIGQPLSMLLKLSPVVDELACYDIVGTPGVAADLSHVSAEDLTYSTILLDDNRVCGGNDLILY